MVASAKSLAAPQFQAAIVSLGPGADLDLRAAREEETAREHYRAVAGPDGITRGRVETGHGRLLDTLFGTVQVTRCAWRRPGAGNLYPADAALSLPARRHSHTLARLAVLEAARGSFEAAHAAITGRCGPVIGKRQIEQAVVNAARDISAFYAARIPEPCTASTLLVLSADAKGIVMRPGALRPATAKAAARQGKMRTRLAAGEKPNRKRMATLACVYDAEPAPRRPHDVIAPPGGRHGCRKPRPGPKARARWLAGSVEHDPAEVIAAAFDQAEARDPAHRRRRVVLVDGAEHQLDLIRAEAARRGVTISILIDLIHVLELSTVSVHENRVSQVISLLRLMCRYFVVAGCGFQPRRVSWRRSSRFSPWACSSAARRAWVSSRCCFLRWVILLVSAWMIVLSLSVPSGGGGFGRAWSRSRSIRARRSAFP